MIFVIFVTFAIFVYMAAIRRWRQRHERRGPERANLREFLRQGHLLPEIGRNRRPSHSRTLLDLRDEVEERPAEVACREPIERRLL